MVRVNGAPAASPAAAAPGARRPGRGGRAPAARRRGALRHATLSQHATRHNVHVHYARPHTSTLSVYTKHFASRYLLLQQFGP